MSANDPRRADNPPATTAGQPKRTIRDIPGCIKYIILLFLLLLLFAEYYAGEFRGFPKVSQLVWLIFFFKLLLIILLLILIWVQRQLVCKITEPTGCAKEDIDPATGNPRLTVKGTASGSVFGHYTLELQGHPECVASYPPGGGSTQVTSGVLGWIDTSPVSPGDYTVVLRVFPSGAGSPCVKTSLISILRAPVWIDKVGRVKTYDIGPHPVDSSERLRIIEAGGPGTAQTAVGGVISIEGGAYLEGCQQKMFEYALDYQKAPYAAAAPFPAPPQADAPPATWTNILTLPYGDVPQHPYTWSCGFLIGIPNFITHGILTSKWSVDNCSIFPPHPLYYTESDYSKWDTTSPTSLNGRYTVRVHERHKLLVPPGTVGDLYEAATIWIDNRAIIAKIRKLMIHGGASLDVCAELSLSQFLPSRLADIIGQAWDPLILDAVDAPIDFPPNENFGGYSLQFAKDGGGWQDIGISVPPGPPPPPPPPPPPLPPLLVNPVPPVLVNPKPVPSVRQVLPPPEVDANDILTSWDIVQALDAGPLPAGAPISTPAPYPKIYRKQRCAYMIYLYVWDKTHVSDDGGHSLPSVFPFCIMNDIPDATTFPWPALP